MARPTDYNEEAVLKLTQEYIDICEDEEDEFHKTRGVKSDGYDRLIRVRLPTIEGLALHLGINKTTVYEWESKYPEFSNVLEDLRAKQAKNLVDKGLSGDYNPVIAKLLLMKHGYVEKTETDLTSKGEKITQVIGINIHKPNDEPNNPGHPSNV
jgi:hypothetical protein